MDNDPSMPAAKGNSVTHVETKGKLLAAITELCGLYGLPILLRGQRGDSLIRHDNRRGMGGAGFAYYAGQSICSIVKWYEGEAHG